MTPPGTRVPFGERGGRLRGVIDLVTGCYPAFLFGGPVGATLPVFHIHDVTPASLEPRLQYLAENGYVTVTSDAVARLVRDGVSPGERAVTLCFDDAWASVWTVAGPLLRRYGMRGITFAIPGRIEEADRTRPTFDTAKPSAVSDGAAGSPFVTWPELAALHESGTIDVQSHSWSHEAIFSADVLVGFLDPAALAGPLLERPIAVDGRIRPLDATDLGTPLFVRRSRFSDAFRFIDDPDGRTRSVAHVAANGGRAFFERRGWREELERVLGPPQGTYETEAARDRSIREDLARSRDELGARLKTPAVRHLCFPWGIAGRAARDAARELGFETAYSDAWLGRRAVRAGDNPFRLMRLHERFIACLPGQPRRLFFTAA